MALRATVSPLTTHFQLFEGVCSVQSLPHKNLPRLFTGAIFYKGALVAANILAVGLNSAEGKGSPAWHPPGFR